MKKTIIATTIAMAVTLAGCASVETLPLGKHVSANGKKIMIGQIKPGKSHHCKTRFSEKQPWGMKAHVNAPGAYNDIVQAALKTAPKHRANYVRVTLPRNIEVMGMDMNVKKFEDAKVTYYRCNKLPRKS